MKELLVWVRAYVSISIHRMIPIFIIGALLYGIFWVLMKKEVTRHYEKTYQSWICGMLLSLEIAFIFVMTLYGRTVKTGRGIRLLPFASYIEALQPENIELLLQVIMNVVMFVPLGILLPLNFKYFEKGKSVILTTLVISVVIESVQGVLQIGMFEVDDILGNVFGAGIGFVCYQALRWLKKRNN